MSVFLLITASPILSVLFLLTYFSPVIVAFVYDHPRIGLIALLNLCFGWTGIGWIALMVWAWSKKG